MSDDVESQLAEDLAAQLLIAHRRVQALGVADDEKALASRRLLAISDASKHDVARASKRLRAFLNELDVGRISASEPSDGP